MMLLVRSPRTSENNSEKIKRKINKGVKYILKVTNALTKYVWWVTLKGKSAKEVTETMEKRFARNKHNPRNVQVSIRDSIILSKKIGVKIQD